jgi:hypothetical protein
MRRCIAQITGNAGDAKPGMKTEDALAGDGRGADEKPQLPLTRNRDRLGLGRRSPQFDQNNRSGYWGDRDRSMHYDAKLTVVGVNRARVNVGDLGDRQRSQQDQAQARYHRQKIHSAAVLPA